MSFRLRFAVQTALCFACVFLLLSDVHGADVLPPVSQRFAKRNTTDVPDFQRHIVPLLGRLGCNAASCHGSFQGRGSFRLSLFGFDFQKDHAGLNAKSSSVKGSRLNLNSPDNSLIIQKPTLQVDHEGGKRFSKSSWEHHLLLRWIELGAKGTSKSKTISKLVVHPKEIVFRDKNDSAQLKVIAVWKDGFREDVTCLCRFRTNDDSVVQVNRNGKAVAVGRGDTHIVAFYDNGVSAIPVMRPLSDIPLITKPVQYANPIDQFVAEKLTKLRIVPSRLCTDAEFLRRVSIDMTGSLPTPDEIVIFLADKSAGKRAKKIDELLTRPAYAAWWANKLCDFTGCSPKALTNVTEVGQAMAVQWYQWIYRRVKNNTPYDELVKGIVLSEGRSASQSYENYSAEMSSYVRRKSPADFSRRTTMPHFWTRDGVKEAKAKALAFAHSFLGIQLQCAQCHKHPFDQWTQQDFTSFTQFFETIQVRGRRVGFPQFAAARSGRTIPWPSLSIERGTRTKTLTLLRSRRVTLPPQVDPRKPIMQWMRKQENPWFARAFVNRVWAGYFHFGIVHPADAHTPTNPPSNPALLNWLTQGFVKNGFDMKWLHRQIASSQAYQRSWKPNNTNRADRRNFSRAIPRRIPAEVVYDAVKLAVAAPGKIEGVRTNITRRASGHLSMRMAGTYAMKVFGKPDRAVNCDCERVNEPTLLQSMFLQNDPLIRMRLAESGWLLEIANAEKTNTPVDVSQQIQAAWLRTVSRYPTKTEIARAKKHLASTKSINEGLTDLLWALLNTKEFILNH